MKLQTEKYAKFMYWYAIGYYIIDNFPELSK